jgi:hypothetical protein
MGQKYEVMTEQADERPLYRWTVANLIQRWHSWHDIITRMRQLLLQCIRHLRADLGMKSFRQPSIDHDETVCNKPTHLLIVEQSQGLFWSVLLHCFCL